MANQVTTTFSINANQALQQLAQYQQQLRNTIQLQTQLGSGATNPGGGGGGAGIGAAGALGGLGGAIAGAVTFAAVAQGVRTVVNAAKESEAANRALAASALEAGKSYVELAASSKAFADAALISETQAARSTAQLQRLVSLAGEGDQLEKYQKGFLDLAAARGVAFDELDTLFQGIIAGTDDALNRFGKQDPSKLAEQYARSLGKTVEQLTEQEKILSRLKAFDTDFGLFNGANEDRINSFSGAVDRLNKSLGDLASNMGQAFAQNRIVRDNIEFFSQLIGSANTPTDNQTRQMIAQGMTDQQILRMMGGGQTTFYDYLVSAATFMQGVLPSIFGGLEPATPSQVRAGADAPTLAAIAAVRSQMERDANLRPNQPSVSDRLEREFADSEARRKADADAAKKEQERLDLIRKRVAEVRDLISGFAAQENPFVKIFEDAAKSIRRVLELTSGFGAGIRDAALRASQRANLRAYQDAQVANTLERFNLRLEAEGFREGLDLEALTAQQAEMRRMEALRGQLTSIGALGGYSFAGTNQSVDAQIIQLTQGLNPARLDSDIRELAGAAREREAGRLSEQEREARDTFRNLNKILSADGIKVVLGSGEQVVRIVNEAPESASVTTRPSQSATNSRYGN